MDRYEVLIVRSQPILYTILVEAEDPKEAERKAYVQYARGYTDKEQAGVWGLTTSEINYLGEAQNA